MDKWQEVYEDMVHACIGMESQLNTWEHGFLQSLIEQLSTGRQPSEKQVRKLESIHERLYR